MTHAEFIADIQRARSFVDDRNSTMVLSLAAVDHLLAIHAAGVAYFDAEHCYRKALNTADYKTLSDLLDQRNAAYATLAALCGWKAEEGA